jgi:hypothetical protein
MVNNWKFVKLLILLRNTSRLVFSYAHSEQRLGRKESEIIRKIHQIRFNQQNPYLITGGHFSDLFVRNTGIFYNALLDPRIPSSDQDWDNRQHICYQTIKLALEVFSKEKGDATTISHLWGSYYTTSHIYARASDSLYAILYGIKLLTDSNTTISRYPSPEVPTKQLTLTHSAQVSKPMADIQNATTFKGDRSKKDYIAPSYIPAGL